MRTPVSRKGVAVPSPDGAWDEPETDLPRFPLINRQDGLTRGTVSDLPALVGNEVLFAAGFASWHCGHVPSAHSGRGSTADVATKPTISSNRHRETPPLLDLLKRGEGE